MNLIKLLASREADAIILQEGLTVPVRETVQ
jgi:hypothetical protein